MSEKSTSGSQLTPAYVGSSVFSKFLEISNKRSWGKVSIAALKDQGFSESQSYPLLSALKALKLIDEDGNPLPAFESLWQATTEEDTRRALLNVLEGAYPELMKLDLTSHKLITLDGFFRRRGVAPSVATRSARFFVFLANIAGVEIGDEVTVSKSRRSSKKESKEIRKRTEPQELLTEISGDYEEQLLALILRKVNSTSEVPDVETIREIRDLAKAVEEKKRRYADGPEPDASNKQESEEEA